MENTHFSFIDHTGKPDPPIRLIPPVVIKKELLDAEVDRLASLPAPANGRRVSVVAHADTGVGEGLANGIRVSLCVLKPGERSKLIRHNSSLVDFCIRGAGTAEVGEHSFSVGQFDVWTTPGWTSYSIHNQTSQLMVRLSYSNAPLLEKLAVHIVDEEPKIEAAVEKKAELDPAKRSPFGTFELLSSAAWLMPYEQLINPDHIEVRPLHWPWEKVKTELDRLRSLGKDYVGRRLYLLFDPSTGRTNGTTHTFFAAITIRPANIVDRPHRHASAAINYYFAGKGHSVVEKQRYDWAAGDLMLSAPGWAVHNHASDDEDVYELTIQDQPMHLALGSLLWQESLKEAPKLLGMGAGFATNRGKAGK